MAHSLSKKWFFKRKPHQYFGKVCKWKGQCIACIDKEFWTITHMKLEVSTMAEFGVSISAPNLGFLAVVAMDA
jgi:hypothetical protein